MNCCKCGGVLPEKLEKNAILQGRGVLCESCSSSILSSLVKQEPNRERPEVDDLIDNVIPEFCDQYCRFPREHIVDFMADDLAFH